MTKEKVNEIITYVQSLFPEPIYLVGGACRSILMGIEPADYDFCSGMTTEQIKECLKGKHKTHNVGERFGTIGFNYSGVHIEITQFRAEEYEEGNRKPKVTYITNITEDLSRRDFTINSTAMKSDGKFIDLFNGRKDIENKIIRCVGNPTIRFKEDCLRLLRACRFASQLDFDIEPATLKSMKKNAHHILDTSKERWVQEMDKLLMGKNVIKGLNYMWETKLFMYMIPELQLQYNFNQRNAHHKLLLHEHTAQVVKNCSQDIDLKYACLLHDLGKVFCYEDKGDRNIYPKHEIVGKELVLQIGKYLKFSNDRLKKVSEIVGNHLNEDSPIKKFDDMAK